MAEIFKSSRTQFACFSFRVGLLFKSTFPLSNRTVIFEFILSYTISKLARVLRHSACLVSDGQINGEMEREKC